MRTKLQAVPLDIRRRVAHKLESIRESGMVPGLENAYLGAEVCPVYRPDIKDVAYWEFEIAGLKEVMSRQHEGKSSGVGFMLASTGSHDIPIPHWSVNNEPPSRALESKSKQTAARIFKLDTLTYAAEDASGKYLAHIGQMPLQVLNPETDMSKYMGINTVTTTLKAASTDDKSPSEVVVKKTDVAAQKLKLSSWESLDGVKKGFAGTYRLHLDAHVRRAAPAWEIENLIAKFGEGILEGRHITVPLMGPGKASVTGDGAKFVKLTMLDRKFAPAVTLEALPAPEKKELNFQLAISYADGTSENLPFFIVPKGTPSNKKSIVTH